MSPWIFLRFLFLPAIVIAGNLLGGWWNFSIPVLCFIIHPVIGLLSGKNSSIHEEDNSSHYDEKAYRLVPLLFIPPLVFITTLSIIQSDRNSMIEFIGIALSVGIVNGILGFTLAHELIHRHTRLERTAGYVLLLQNNYTYYGIEHIGGHHVYACTEKDPHTARLGESLYRFLPRAILFTFLNAWEIESNRLKRKEKKVISRHNRMLIFFLLQFFCYSIILAFPGWKPFLFFISQSVVAILLLNVTG